MITPGTPNPSGITPGQSVCIPFSATGSGTPSVTVSHENGGTITPTVTANTHPVGTFSFCFTWPPGNTASDVTIVVGNESVTFTVAGTGGP